MKSKNKKDAEFKKIIIDVLKKNGKNYRKEFLKWCKKEIEFERGQLQHLEEEIPEAHHNLEIWFGEILMYIYGPEISEKLKEIEYEYN